MVQCGQCFYFLQFLDPFTYFAPLEPESPSRKFPSVYFTEGVNKNINYFGAKISKDSKFGRNVSSGD